MILQLNMTTTDRTPAVFRTIQVPNFYTFEQLENIINAAFDYLNDESYLFDIKKSDGKRQDDAYIGIDFAGDFLIDDDLILDDEEETLQQWLTKKGDLAIYTLPDEQLELSIEVTNITTPQAHLQYPICIDGKGHLDPSEKGKLNLQDISEQIQLMASLDEEFLDLLLNDEETEPDWAPLLTLADQLKKLKPWEYFYDSEIIVIEDPITNEFYFVSILGAAGQEFGIAVYIGMEGLQQLEQLFQNSLTEDFYFDLRSLTVSYTDRDELTSDDYKLIKEYGFTFRGKKNWIQFRSYVPGFFPWLPLHAEVESLKLILEQTIEMVHLRKQGWNYPSLPPHQYLLRHIDKQKNKWQESVVSFNKPDVEHDEIYVDLNDLDFKKLQKKKISNMEVEFDLFYLPHAVKEEFDERPYYPCVVVAIDTQSGLVIFQDVLPMPKNEFSAQNILIEFLQSIDHKPKVVHVTPQIASYVKVLTKKLGIQITTGSLHEVEQLKHMMRTMPMM